MRVLASTQLSTGMALALILVGIVAIGVAANWWRRNRSEVVDGTAISSEIEYLRKLLAFVGGVVLVFIGIIQLVR